MIINMTMRILSAIFYANLSQLFFSFMEENLADRPVWTRGRCRISPPRFLAECCKRQLNQVSLVLLCSRLSAFSDCIEFVYLYFSVLFCLSVSVKRLAVKTASEMTYTVLGAALNSTQTKPNQIKPCG